ncbi:hypothetical protein [Phreatobacter sp. AB_2022a]|uniref:hypothetical protein n=1 Tax=Phreatobacter sp. AB_2022a TaxID=3003134 RepID=UPI0022876671|nr:hypothetical protein [Phreatobacter sp. AB_2022a]MCZ0738156.1 hypothetical protein [Phreatobacter sp. AB_2022a]
MMMLGLLLTPLGVLSASEQTRIEIDQVKGEVVFIIKGQPAARIVSSGLIVPGDIRYGGMIADGGPAVDAR